MRCTCASDAEYFDDPCDACVANVEAVLDAIADGSEPLVSLDEAFAQMEAATIPPK